MKKCGVCKNTKPPAAFARRDTCKRCATNSSAALRRQSWWNAPAKDEDEADAPPSPRTIDVIHL